MLTHPQVEPTSRAAAPGTRNRAVGGLILILLGVFLLAAQITNWSMSWLVLAALAAVFLVWGLAIRTFGLLIPGGILAGLALGVALIERSVPLLSEVNSAGVFLMAFALGWGLLTLLSIFTDGGFRWWPLIPGGILAAVGGALMAGPQGLLLLSYMNYLWPLALIAVGIFILLRRR